MISKEWINKNYSKISYLITHFWMIKKRPSHGKIVILTAVYFSANHEKHLLTFLVLQNGVRPTERALRQFTQPRRNFTYYRTRAQKCKIGVRGPAVKFWPRLTGEGFYMYLKAIRWVCMKNKKRTMFKINMYKVMWPPSPACFVTGIFLLRKAPDL